MRKGAEDHLQSSQTQRILGQVWLGNFSTIEVVLFCCFMLGPDQGHYTELRVSEPSAICHLLKQGVLNAER